MQWVPVTKRNASRSSLNKLPAKSSLRRLELSGEARRNGMTLSPKVYRLKAQMHVVAEMLTVRVAQLIMMHSPGHRCDIKKDHPRKETRLVLPTTARTPTS